MSIRPKQAQKSAHLYSPPEQISTIDTGSVRPHNLILPVQGHSAAYSQHVPSGRRTATSGVTSPEMVVRGGEPGSVALLSRDKYPKS